MQISFLKRNQFVKENIDLDQKSISPWEVFSNKRWRKLKGQSRMDIPETRATLGTRHNLKKRNKIKKTLHGQLKR
jgi:hypothetical protein